MDKIPIPDLHFFNSFTGRLIEEYAKERDIDGIASLMSQRNSFGFVAANVEWLKSYDAYERCLVVSWTSAYVNPHEFPLYEQKRLFRIADRKRLRAAGEPMPKGKKFVLYRGCSGAGLGKNKYGISWTDDLYLAKHRATESIEGSIPIRPVVYRTLVDEKNVYAYSLVMSGFFSEFMCDISSDAVISEVWNAGV